MHPNSQLSPAVLLNSKDKSVLLSRCCLEPMCLPTATCQTQGTDTDALDYALNRAIDAWYNDKPWFRSLQKRVMEQASDHSPIVTFL